MKTADNNSEIGEVLPPQAYEILVSEPDAVLLDVRSRVEFDYVGHPPGAINIPWQEAPDWDVDPAFVTRVRQSLEAVRPDQAVEELTLLTLCRSGGRSMAAAKQLTEKGFSRVINIAEGFEGGLDADRHRGKLGGWRFHQLPWEQT